MNDSSSLPDPPPSRRAFAFAETAAGLVALLFSQAAMAAAPASHSGPPAPVSGPSPSFGLGNGRAVLVQNWDFGTEDTIRNTGDLDAAFRYHDQFKTIANGTKYGAMIVASSAATALPGQPVEGVDCPPVRAFTRDSLKTFLQPLRGAKEVHPVTAKAGCGSFVAKWTLPAGGPHLGADIIWETRVRMVTPPYFWFALWTSGRIWENGAEHDLVESFGYDNGGGRTNFDGRFWHSNSVAGLDADQYREWDVSMNAAGIGRFDATQYHVWTWIYRADGTYGMYVDGVLVQHGQKPYWWTVGAKEEAEPIDVVFLFDASWGHTEVASVNHPLPATALEGKYYEFDYSRVYLVPKRPGFSAEAMR